MYLHDDDWGWSAPSSALEEARKKIRERNSAARAAIKAVRAAKPESPTYVWGTLDGEEIEVDPMSGRIHPVSARREAERIGLDEPMGSLRAAELMAEALGHELRFTGHKRPGAAWREYAVDYAVRYQKEPHCAAIANIVARLKAAALRDAVLETPWPGTEY